MRPVDNRIPFPFASVRTYDGNLAVTVHCHGFTRNIFHGLQIEILDHALASRPYICLLHSSAGGSPDMKCPHCELCARFSNRLSSEDADRLPDLHRLSICQVPSIALGA